MRKGAEAKKLPPIYRGSCHTLLVPLLLFFPYSLCYTPPCRMRKDAEAKKLPPIYRGKWAKASKEEVDEMMAKGVPYCYRFRVPPVRKTCPMLGFKSEPRPTEAVWEPRVGV